MVDGRFEKIEGTDFELECELVLLAMGFVGAGASPACSSSSASSSTSGATCAATRVFATTVDGVFVCGDMGRGQSLIVWAIAEGRSAAAAVDEWLMGSTALPAPIAPTARPLM